MRLASIVLAGLLAAAPASAVTVLAEPTPIAAPAVPHQAQQPNVRIASLANPGDVRTGLPEPQVWTTMIIGFALVGFAARWRRPSTVPQA